MSKRNVKDVFFLDMCDFNWGWFYLRRQATSQNPTKNSPSRSIARLEDMPQANDARKYSLLLDPKVVHINILEFRHGKVIDDRSAGAQPFLTCSNYLLRWSIMSTK